MHEHVAEFNLADLNLSFKRGQKYKRATESRKQTDNAMAKNDKKTKWQTTVAVHRTHHYMYYEMRKLRTEQYKLIQKPITPN